MQRLDPFKLQICAPITFFNVTRDHKSKHETNSLLSQLIRAARSNGALRDGIDKRRAGVKRVGRVVQRWASVLRRSHG